MNSKVLKFIRDYIGPKWSMVIGFAALFGVSVPDFTELLSNFVEYLQTNPDLLGKGALGVVLGYFLRVAPAPDVEDTPPVTPPTRNPPPPLSREERPEPSPVVHPPGTSPTGKNYFSDSEFYCHGKTCNCVFPGMDITLMTILNTLREHFNAKTHVWSGYRCEEYNSSIKDASKNSFHMFGKAADIVVEGVDPKEVYGYLIAMYPNKFGIGLYARFVHIDVRTVGYARKESANDEWFWNKETAA